MFHSEITSVKVSKVHEIKLSNTKIQNIYQENGYLIQHFYCTEGTELLCLIQNQRASTLFKTYFSIQYFSSLTSETKVDSPHLQMTTWRQICHLKGVRPNIKIAAHPAHPVFGFNSKVPTINYHIQSKLFKCSIVFCF